MEYEKKCKDALERAKEIHSFSSDIAEIKRMEQIFPELAESEDEKVRRNVKRAISVALDYSYFDKETTNNCLAWLEKQGEHKRFRDSILVGDNVTKNEDGYIVNLSQLRRVAKRDADVLEKQGGIDNSPLEGSTNFVMTGSSKKTDERNPEEFIEAHTEWSNALQEGFVNADMARKAVEMERERIKAEIERRREAVDDHNLYLDNGDQGLGYSLALDDMLNFICKKS